MSKKSKITIKRMADRQRGRSEAGFESRMFGFIKLLIVTTILGGISYASLAGFMVFNVSDISRIEKEIESKKAEIANLEHELSTIEKNLTLASALRIGFSQSPSVKYITSKPLTRVSLNNNEI